MSIGTINTPVKLNKTSAISRCYEQQVNNTTLLQYQINNQHETIEHKIKKLISYLSNIEQVIIPQVGSKLDCVDKIDILIELQDGATMGFQVKSGKNSKSNATVFSKKNNVGVLYVDYIYNPLVLLFHLSKFLKLEIRDDVINVLKLVKLYRGKLLPLRMVNLSNVQIEILTTLQLVQIRAKNIQF